VPRDYPPNTGPKAPVEGRVKTLRRHDEIRIVVDGLRRIFEEPAIGLRWEAIPHPGKIAE
jgi:hypothetical protein